MAAKKDLSHKLGDGLRMARLDHPPKLDKKDWEIISELAKNGRAPYISIAKKVGLSKDAVKYRVEKMMKEEIILGYVPVFNPVPLGYLAWADAFFTLQNITPEKEKEFVRYLNSSRYTSYFFNTIGRWDYVVEIVARDPGHLYDIMHDIRSKFSNIIKESEIITVMKMHKLSMYPWEDKEELPK